MNIQEWFTDTTVFSKSNRKYSHFDFRTNILKQKLFITNPLAVARHGFFPFIHYKKVYFKYSRETGTTIKTRNIYYASHKDSCIYQYYSYLLNEAYNNYMLSQHINHLAVAYRTNLHKSNINFAKAAYDFIKTTSSCSIMIGDFTNFFDNIEHKYLKQQWCNILGVKQLPNDHYNIYKNITKYSYWERSDLLKINQIQNNGINAIKFLNNKKKVLSLENFKSNKNYIHKNPNHYGIPQGAPISAVLSNIYMTDTDKAINKIVLQYNGFYMRYSDDFIIVLPNNTCIKVSSIFSEILKIINSVPHLILQPQKTKFYTYDNHSIIDNNKTRTSINFLGFTFDGIDTRINPKIITKYFYKMHRKVKTIINSQWITKKGNRISCKILYQYYSKKGINNKKGNIITYCYRTQKIFSNEKKICTPLMNNMEKIKQALKRK